jgi:hypothetical protein
MQLEPGTLPAVSTSSPTAAPCPPPHGRQVSTASALIPFDAAAASTQSPTGVLVCLAYEILTGPDAALLPWEVEELFPDAPAPQSAAETAAFHPLTAGASGAAAAQTLRMGQALCAASDRDGWDAADGMVARLRDRRPPGAAALDLLCVTSSLAWIVVQLAPGAAHLARIFPGAWESAEALGHLADELVHPPSAVADGNDWPGMIASAVDERGCAGTITIPRAEGGLTVHVCAASSGEAASANGMLLSLGIDAHDVTLHVSSQAYSEGLLEQWGDVRMIPDSGQPAELLREAEGDAARAGVSGGNTTALWLCPGSEGWPRTDSPQVQRVVYSVSRGVPRACAACLSARDGTLQQLAAGAHEAMAAGGCQRAVLAERLPSRSCARPPPAILARYVGSDSAPVPPVFFTAAAIPVDAEWCAVAVLTCCAAAGASSVALGEGRGQAVSVPRDHELLPLPAASLRAAAALSGLHERDPIESKFAGLALLQPDARWELAARLTDSGLLGKGARHPDESSPRDVCLHTACKIEGLFAVPPELFVIFTVIAEPTAAAGFAQAVSHMMPPRGGKEVLPVAVMSAVVGGGNVCDTMASAIAKFTGACQQLRDLPAYLCDPAGDCQAVLELRAALGLSAGSAFDAETVRALRRRLRLKSRQARWGDKDAAAMRQCMWAPGDSKKPDDVLCTAAAGHAARHALAAAQGLQSDTPAYALAFDRMVARSNLSVTVTGVQKAAEHANDAAELRKGFAFGTKLQGLQGLPVPKRDSPPAAVAARLATVVSGAAGSGTEGIKNIGKYMAAKAARWQSASTGAESEVAIGSVSLGMDREHTTEIAAVLGVAAEPSAAAGALASVAATSSEVTARMRAFDGLMTGMQLHSQMLGAWLCELASALAALARLGISASELLEQMRADEVVAADFADAAETIFLAMAPADFWRGGRQQLSMIPAKMLLPYALGRAELRIARARALASRVQGGPLPLPPSATASRCVRVAIISTTCERNAANQCGCGCRRLTGVAIILADPFMGSNNAAAAAFAHRGWIAGGDGHCHYLIARAERLPWDSPTATATVTGFLGARTPETAAAAQKTTGGRDAIEHACRSTTDGGLGCARVLGLKPVYAHQIFDGAGTNALKMIENRSQPLWATSEVGMAPFPGGKLPDWLGPAT